MNHTLLSSQVTKMTKKAPIIRRIPESTSLVHPSFFRHLSVGLRNPAENPTNQPTNIHFKIKRNEFLMS